MKTLYIYVSFIILSILSPNLVQAQIWKRIQKNIENKVSNEAENRINKRTDKGIDKAYDGIENSIDGKQTNSEIVETSSAHSESNTNSSINNTSTNRVARSQSALFNSTNKSSLEKDKFIKEPHNYAFIVLSDKNGNVVPKQGDFYVYKTSEGSLGKFEIVRVDKHNNYRTTFRYITYNGDGSIKSQSNSLVVEGTYGVDFDNGDGRAHRPNADFQLSRSDENYTEISGTQDGTMIKLYDKSSAINNPSAPTVKWSKFDFVPGDIVIFEDGPSVDEENGEFPSKWDLDRGNAEIAEVDGVNVVIFPNGGRIVPYLKDSDKDYLPEVFTVEFDTYFQPEKSRRVFMNFYDQKNQNHVGHSIYFYQNSISIDASSGTYQKELPEGGWRHFSIAVTKDKLKIYLNDTRLINIPHMGFNPTGISLEMDGYSSDKVHQYIKNFRIAKGGVKYYNSVLSDGKIIVNGIRFDINKATIKPESNGAINKIYKLMVKRKELNFSIEGHTDADGNDTNNMNLSKERGKAVMDRLISMGITADRLKYGGFGESKPIDSNTSTEGKANNRRVEFVKF